MKKTIIAAAIAAVVAAPAAMAEVSIYGKAHMAYENKDAATDVDQIDDRASRLGFKANEDLGNGLSAFVKYEFGTEVMDGTANTLTARDAIMGLKGDFGTVAVGRMGAPVKGTLYAIGNVQLADGNGGADFAGSFDSKGYRVDNAIAYMGSFNGVDVAVATTGNDSTDNHANTSISLGTTIGGVKVSVAQLNQDGTADDVLIAGAKMSMDALTIGVVYEDVDDASNDTETTGISASYAMGANVVSAFASSRDFQSAASPDEDRMGLGFEHKLSKKTSIYASYADVDTGATATSYDITSVGMIVNF
jgi:predicted porin